MREADKQNLADHYLDLYRIAYLLLHNQTDVEDAVQEALAITMSRPILFGDPYKFCTRVLRNICINFLKRNREVLPDKFWDISAPEENPNEKRLQLLSELLNQLPSRTAEIIHLSYNQGYTQSEIAQMKGISESMVKKLLYQGYDQLRKQIIEIETANEIFKL